LRRSLRCTPAPTAHLHRYFVARVPTWRFGPFHHRPPMTSSTPFDDFWTTFGSRFDTDVNLQAGHQCDCAVRRCALQPIAGCRPFSCPIQGGVSHPVKKPGLDITHVCSYRPISNLSMLSKLLERLFAGQLRDYLTSAELLHTAATVRHSSPVVSVVSAWSNTVCMARVSQIINSSSDVWCASRVSGIGSPVRLLFILYNAELMSDLGPCGVVDSTLAFGSIGHGFESEHSLFSHHSVSAFSKLTSLAKCSLDDSVRRLL